MEHSTVVVTQHKLTYFNFTDEDEGYLCLPLLESTGLEEEYICLPSHEGKEKDAEEEEMDEEQQVLCEGSFVFGMCNSIDGLLSVHVMVSFLVHLIRSETVLAL